MALQVCAKCGTRYAPAAVCPHCGSDLWISELAADERPAAAEAAPEPPAPPAGDGEDDGPPDYTAYRLADLRDLARDRGLPVTGVKADLAAALAQWDAEHPDGDDPGDAPDAAVGGDD